MSLHPLRWSAVVATALTLAVLPLAPAGAALPPPPPLVTYWSVPYGPDLYAWWNPATVPPSRFRTTGIQPMPYFSWSASGFPSPSPAPTRYVRYPWSSAVYALSTMSGDVLTHHLTYTEWATAGFPSPQVTGRIDGTVFEGYSGTPEIYATLDGEDHLLTFQEWTAAGSPTPRTVGWRPDAEYVKWETGPDIYAVTDDDQHRLTYAEWTAWGSPAPALLAGGFYKLSWQPAIAFIPGNPGTGVDAQLLSYSDWLELGTPQPYVTISIQGDSWCRADTDTVHYSGATFDGDLSLEEATRNLQLDTWSLYEMDEC